MAAAQINQEAIARQQAAEKDPVPDNRGMYLSVIAEMQDKGLYFASLAHIDAFELKYGASPDIELLRGHALREAGQSAESRAVYTKLLNTPMGAAAAQGLGLLAGARGDYVGAVTFLRDAAKRDPTNASIVSDLGYALLREGDTAGARLPIAQAAELAPDSAKILSNFALLLLVSGQPERADAVMTKAALPAGTQAAVRRMAGDILLSRLQHGQGDAALASASDTVRPQAVVRMPVVSNLSSPTFASPIAPAPAVMSNSVRSDVSAGQAMMSGVAQQAPAVQVAPSVAGAPTTAPMQRMLDRFTTGSP